MKIPTYKAQAIIETEKSWPYIGNAYLNKDGSLSLLLDRRIKLVLADGTTLQAEGQTRVKLFLRAPRTQSQVATSIPAPPAHAAAEARPAAYSGVHIF